MKYYRPLIFAPILAAVFAVSGVPGAMSAETPAVIKPYGMAIPSFFFPAAEQRAREACAQNLPTCRSSVRAEMYQEMSISLAVPWVLLGVAILVLLFRMRSQEKKKEQARAAARRHHDPGAFRKLDREKTAKTTNDDDAEDLS